jgi:hypothetical protein
VENVIYSFWQKMGWATYWAIFSQTHPVTLAESRRRFWPTDKLWNLCWWSPIKNGSVYLHTWEKIMGVSLKILSGVNLENLFRS